jgi:hypothetical protein
MVNRRILGIPEIPIRDLNPVLTQNRGNRVLNPIPNLNPNHKSKSRSTLAGRAEHLAL